MLPLGMGEQCLEEKMEAPGEYGGGGLQETHSPVWHLFEQSCPGVKCPSAGTLNCISSPLWGLVQPE